MCIGNRIHPAIIEESIQHRAQQHLKGSRGADPCRADYIACNIRIKSTYLKSFLLKSLQKSLNQIHSSCLFGAGLQIVQINSKFLLKGLADNVYLRGIILCRNAYTVQVNASGKNLAVIVIRVISTDLRRPGELNIRISRSPKVFWNLPIISR